MFNNSAATSFSIEQGESRSVTQVGYRPTGRVSKVSLPLRIVEIQ